MRKKEGNTNGILINIKMGKMNLTPLSQEELNEINGGFLMLIIGFLLPKPQRIFDFVEGAKEGYERATLT
jgi:hypothetical protein